MLSLDRSNIANAVTDTILHDVNVTNNDINVRYQLLSLGIVLFEIPSNIILQRVPPRPLFANKDRPSDMDHWSDNPVGNSGSDANVL